MDFLIRQCRHFTRWQRISDPINSLPRSQWEQKQFFADSPFPTSANLSWLRRGSASDQPTTAPLADAHIRQCRLRSLRCTTVSQSVAAVSRAAHCTAARLQHCQHEAQAGACPGGGGQRGRCGCSVWWAGVPSARPAGCPRTRPGGLPHLLPGRGDAQPGHAAPQVPRGAGQVRAGLLQTPGISYREAATTFREFLCFLSNNPAEFPVRFSLSRSLALRVKTSADETAPHYCIAADGTRVPAEPRLPLPGHPPPAGGLPRSGPPQTALSRQHPLPSRQHGTISSGKQFYSPFS